MGGGKGGRGGGRKGEDRSPNLEGPEGDGRGQSLLER